MKLIFGLGNPGLRYKNTRHNIGFLTLDSFAKANGIKINKKGFHSLFGKMVFDEEQALLVKPQTFMNNSGEAIKAAVVEFGVGPEDILVVCDDINLELGIIRLRAKGSAGGHKGLESILNKLHTENFNRLRIGIGSEKRKGVLRDYVLSGFRAGEKKILKEAVDSAKEAIGVWLEEGIESAMNKFNTKMRWG